MVEIETDDANHIKAVALIRQSVTTHCVNTEQRYIELEHTQKISNTLSVKVPPNKNVIPPKYYMLFIVKEDDVPSVAPLCSCQFSLTWETELVIPRINEFKGLLFEDAYTEAINSINTKT